MDRRLHHRLHRLTNLAQRRNPLRSEQDAFALLIWAIAIAVVVALAARYVGAAAAVPLLLAGLGLVARFYFAVGLRSADSRPRRRRRPYRGPSRKRERADRARRGE